MTKLCIVIAADTFEEALDDIGRCKNCDSIEIRLDHIKNLDEKKLKRLFVNNPKKLIITCRPKKFGGLFIGKEKDRISILRTAIEHGADYIDIESETDESTLRNLISNKKKTKIIISHHDYSKTPDLGKLESIYKKICSYSPDYVKIAVFANSINDCFKIFKLLEGKKNLIALCMGIKGQITRIFSNKFGSYMNYASLQNGKESAAGQLSFRELTDEYNFKTTNKSTKLLGVIGEHAENSKSRFMHNSNFKNLGLDYLYVPLKVEKSELEIFMKHFREFNFSGAAVTVPHKEAIVNYIDELDDTAKTIGATNTLVTNKDMIIGYNTDYFGAIEALKEKTNLKEKKVLILGVGGAARAIIYGLKKENSSITLVNRTKERAKKLAKEFNVEFDDFNCLNELMKTQDIIINTTSVGMNPRPDECIVKDLPEKKIVMDIVYNPIQTKFIKLAKKRKCMVITGERMLVHQAIGQFEKWTGVKPNFEDMEKALLKRIE